MGIGALAVNYYNNQNVHYGLSGASERMETSFGDEISGMATSLSESSDKGKRIGSNIVAVIYTYSSVILCNLVGIMLYFMGIILLIGLFA